MSPTVRDTPRPFQPAVAQRDIELEVAQCVGGVLSPLLANIALSVLDDHFDQQWQHEMGDAYQRAKRRRNGQGNWKLTRYADLCRTRHKSAYADRRVMPTVVVNVQVGGVAGVGWSA
jgi:hypothetical protein